MLQEFEWMLHETSSDVVAGIVPPYPNVCVLLMLFYVPNIDNIDFLCCKSVFLMFQELCFDTPETVRWQTSPSNVRTLAAPLIIIGCTGMYMHEC